MRKCILLLLIVALIPLLSVADKNDLGMFNDFSVSYAMSPQWYLFSRARVQTRDAFTDVYAGFIDAGLGYKFHPNWRVAAAYRRAWAEVSDDWVTEKRTMAELIWSDKIKEMGLSNRSRLEYRSFEWDTDDDIRYRNQTRVEFPWELVGIHPYLEEEVFFSRNAHRLNQNWLTGGVYYKVSDVLKLRLGYRWVSVRVKDQWDNRSLLVTSVGLSF